MRLRWLLALPALALAGCVSQQPVATPIAPVSTVKTQETTQKERKSMTDEKIENGEKVVKSEEEWRKQLTPEQYNVLREHGTERAFTGQYWNHHEDGSYTCAGCGQVLFTSDTKFDSGCGWPSFFDSISPDKIVKREDNSYGMHRIEVLCSKCGGHLGHVFEDGPNPTGLRYCINSASLDFKKK
jgi:peptide-methionine (R)-S-oxide reductase